MTSEQVRRLKAATSQVRATFSSNYPSAFAEAVMSWIDEVNEALIPLLADEDIYSFPKNPYPLITCVLGREGKFCHKYDHVVCTYKYTTDELDKTLYEAERKYREEISDDETNTNS